MTPNQTFFKSMTAQEYRQQAPDLLRSTAQPVYDREISPWQATTSRNAAALREQQRQREQERREQKQRQSREVQVVLEALGMQKEDATAAPAPTVTADELLRDVPEVKSAAPIAPETTQPVPSPVPQEPELTTQAESGLSPEDAPWRLAGEVLNTYVIVEQGDKIVLIDKHAAHERMNFDKMKEKGYTPMRQVLLAPVVVKPDPAESEILLRSLDLLRSFGFEAEDFGGGDILVREVPDYVEGDEADRVLSEIAGQLLENGGADPASARDGVLHTMACKAAIKGGWKNDPAELEVVARAVMSGQVKYCPHGRPVAIELTRQQLEKQFGRRN